MYESKYSMYLTKNNSRFAEPEEIISAGSPAGSKRRRASGVPLYYDGKRLYVDNSDNHSMIIGPTGCKKTRVTAFTALSTIIDANESAVVNDPKGELYLRTAEHARKQGYTVRVLNFRDPKNSDSWNPLYSAYKLHLNGQESQAVQRVDDFASNIFATAIEHSDDRYWENTAQLFFTGLTLMLLDSVPKEYFNISNVLQMCYQENLLGVRDMLEGMRPDTVAAYGLHSVADLDAERTRSCVYSVMLSNLNSYMKNKELIRMLCNNNIMPYSMGLSPTIVYIIFPDEKGSLNSLVNSFLTQCYEELIMCAEKNGGRLPVRVNFLLDEFSNLPRVDLFENRISEARGRNIRYFIYIQSYSQLRQKYGDNARTILSNCGNWLCFSSREMEFLNEISLICGRELDYNGIEHPLISAAEMQHLRKRDESADVLILRQGMYPFISTLPDFDRLVEYASYPAAGPVVPVKGIDAKYITFKEWFSRVKAGIFKSPYSK